MKKILTFALALVMLLSLNACVAKKIAEAIIPTAAPTAAPTEVPTPEPTEVPTPEPTEEPTPTPEPTPKPLEAADLIGIWSLTSIRYGDSTLSPSDFGMEMYLEFREDGTVRAIQNTYGEYDEDTSTFTIEDGVLKINGEPAITYDAEADTLSFSLDENGTQAEMILIRTPDAVLPTPPPEAAPDDLAAQIVGTWDLSYAIISNSKIPKDLLGETSMTFVFNEDGSASMSNQTQTIDQGLTWKVESAASIGLYAYNVQKIYEMSYDPDAKVLSLYEESSGVTLAFEKIN